MRSYIYMSSQPNHQTSTSNLLHDRLHIPAEKITEKDTCQSQRKGKEQVLHEDHDGSSGAAKKQNHNAKERLRRMRLHASYLTLGTLLPDHSSSSKKKWCAPSIIDRVITYIPKMQNEVEELTLRKQKLVELEKRGPSIRAISVLEIGKSGYEAVVQILLGNRDYLTDMHEEGKGKRVFKLASCNGSARFEYFKCFYCSSLPKSKGVLQQLPCQGDDYITVLKNNIISSLS